MLPSNHLIYGLFILTLIAEFDRTEGWNGAGLTSCAQWLNLHCGISDVVAREKLRVAHAIGKLPLIDAAFREGQVSYSKVRAMTRVATPENEAILLNIARHGTASHVELTVRNFRRTERLEQAALAVERHRRRNVSYRFDDDDSLLINARLPAEVGDLVRLAIERAAEMAESTFDPDEADYSFDGPGRKRAEGLRIMAEQFLTHAEQCSGTAGDRYQVVVHIDQEALSDGAGEAAGRGSLSELEDGPTLAIETARRLACDGSLVGIVEDGQRNPLNIGRKTRAIPAAIRRTLKSRDGGCRFPGCTHTRFTEAHHIVHWAHGGETRLPNLVTLCRFHHHLIHEGGFTVSRLDGGALLFRRPDGSPLPEHAASEKCFRGNNLDERNRRRGIEITPRTIDSRWLGETMDYGIAIDAMIAARERQRSREQEATPNTQA